MKTHFFIKIVIFIEILFKLTLCDILYTSTSSDCYEPVLTEIENLSENDNFDVYNIGFWFRFSNYNPQLKNQNVFSFYSPNTVKRLSLEIMKGSFNWEIQNNIGQNGKDNHIIQVDLEQLKDVWIFIYFSYSFISNEGITFLRITKEIKETDKSYFLYTFENVIQDRLNKQLIFKLGERQQNYNQTCLSLYYFNNVVSFDKEHVFKNAEKLNQYMLFGFQTPPLIEEGKQIEKNDKHTIQQDL